MSFLTISCISDDRSPEAFRQRIEAATQMRAVLAVDNKPNCLIIDEIDGAPTVSSNHPDFGPALAVQWNLS